MRGSDYEAKLGEICDSLDKIVFGDPKLLLEKGEKCEFCPFGVMCERLDYEVSGTK
ncbi:hypothetical protein JW721_00575 [Candidatus Micrarchaeota archaeon]|nr:hypothetical protein [Candidatus Micrarchaeota archaeon]